jgi:hypothetical protein
MTTPADNDPAVQARTEAAGALTQFLTRTADAIDAEQRKFPAMSSLPKPLDVDPGVISDFTTSAAYKQAVEDYISGRVEQNLLITVLQMLRGLLPGIFGGL